MCGIAGIIYRDGARRVGSDMTRMLQSMKHRGPDSTGYALYGAGRKVRARCATSWPTRTTRATSTSSTASTATRPRSRSRLGVARREGRRGRAETDYAFRVDHASTRATSRSSPTTSRTSRTPRCCRSATRSRSSRTWATPRRCADQYHLDDFSGTHAIGHVRMATESDVDISGAHPVLGVPVLGRRRRAQRPADELLPVAAAARAQRPPVPVGVRLRDDRRVPRREDERGHGRSRRR